MCHSDLRGTREFIMKTWVVLAILVAASWDFVTSNKNRINHSDKKLPPMLFAGGLDWPGIPSARNFWFRRKRSVSELMDHVEHKEASREKRSPQFQFPPFEFFPFNGPSLGFQQNGFGGGEHHMIHGYTKQRWKHGNNRGVYPIYS